MFRAAAAAFLFFAAPIFAQDTQVKAKTGDLTQIVIKAGKDASFLVRPEKNIKLFREYDADPATIKLQIFPTEDGEYFLFLAEGSKGKVWVITSTGKIPPPPPPPPAPEDQFQLALRTAYAADGKPAVLAAQLAAIWRNAGPTVNNQKFKTAKEVLETMHTAAEALIEQALPKTRRAIADELNRTLTTNNLALTPENRAKILAQCQRVQAALEGLK